MTSPRGITTVATIDTEPELKLGQVWLRKATARPLKSNPRVSIMDLRVNFGEADKPFDEVLVDRTYSQTGRYRSTWVKESTFRRDHALEFEQETLG